MKRKICVVTGTRAEYGLLSNVMKLFQEDSEFELQIIATGMHLSYEFGLTYQQIEEDGFQVNEKVEMLLSADTSTGVVKSMGLATIGFADAYERLNPELIIILGDRFEMLAAAQTALIMQIPIAHIHGGECTFGAYDDAIRHSITKMATWHFTSTEGHRNRVIQLGEFPERVFNVGAIGIDHTLQLNLMDRSTIYKELTINEDKPFFLITYHPETNGDFIGINILLEALASYQYDYHFVFTKSNADNGGREINEQLQKYVFANKENAQLYDSLGQRRYLSAVKAATLVIGNSSSGLIEVPYLKTPTINCGERQKGRERPASVIDCDLSIESIKFAIDYALSNEIAYEEIFGNGLTANKIYEQLKGISNYKVQKEFYDL
ncbi:UDP-N-acetylglucosamine 2-epimerase (hydrolyzing) [Solibacillus sp. A46]|uniref:UDP-N-acetylglucosamine 2-epimerase (Hydrolyzing) n=1 Tax=Solibacillus faecavium TaxID=2762221 RepID=A0ABR8XUW3_9BACL|nr:UDP-N-acetylglucosamine 2-epimerase [Solibacillus faecavium]MBD8035708.1 UDP-N-acetylglucosamine 2-epimerase (hydrolyzing) [Solibacillus faecavium]